MAPYLAPHASTHTDPTRIVFVPVDGRIVFWTCVVLIVFCLVEFGMRLHQGVEHDKES